MRSAGYIGLLTHCNVAMRFGPLSLVFNTPELHRWHHSMDLREGNKNYGENLAIWDLLFGTWFNAARRPPAATTERGPETPDEDVSWALKKRFDDFDYGYALTVHKAQGSQWDDVMLFDESFAFKETRERWLYTAITRAAEKLTVVR